LLVVDLVEITLVEVVELEVSLLTPIIQLDLTQYQ
jgi:hypothetical protein